MVSLQIDVFFTLCFGTKFSCCATNSQVSRKCHSSLSQFDRNCDRAPPTSPIAISRLRFSSLAISPVSRFIVPIAGDAQCSAKSNRALEQRPSTTNRVDSLTRLRRCAPSRDALTSRSVFVPRVPTGFPARRYSWLSIIARPPARLRHGLTRSD